MKDGLPFVTYDSKVIEDAWKYLLSLCTEVNKLSTLNVLYEQLLKTLDEVLATKFTEDETTMRLRSKHKQYRNLLVEHARELFLLRFTKAENKVNQNIPIRKYITQFGKLIGDWQDDLEEPNRKINLQEVNVTRLDFSGLDISHVNISVDQLSQVTVSTHRYLIMQWLSPQSGFPFQHSSKNSSVPFISLKSNQFLIIKFPITPSKY
jgi:hypothetical protein